MTPGHQSVAVNCWYDPVNNQQFVIKFLKEQQEPLKKKAQYDKGEIMALRAGEHPHIVKTYCLLLRGEFDKGMNEYPFTLIHSAGDWQETAPNMRPCAVICEHIQGMDMYEFLNTSQSSPKYFGNPTFIIPIVLAITRALIHLHERNIIFRDLKAENIIINPTNLTPTLVDFGFARELSHFERTSSFCGTPEMMAPELIRLEQAGSDKMKSSGYSYETEIWAVGQMLLYLLTDTYVTEHAEERAEKTGADTTAAKYKAVLNFADWWPFLKRKYIEDHLVKITGCKPSATQKKLIELTVGLLDSNPAQRCRLKKLRDELKKLGQNLSIPDQYSYLDDPAPPKLKIPSGRTDSEITKTSDGRRSLPLRP